MKTTTRCCRKRNIKLQALEAKEAVLREEVDWYCCTNQSAPSDSGWASSKTELPLDDLVLSTRKNQRSGERLLPGLVPK